MTSNKNDKSVAVPDSEPQQAPVDDTASGDAGTRPKENGGRDGPEPTRYGDWEKNGRCIDF